MKRLTKQSRALDARAVEQVLGGSEGRPAPAPHPLPGDATRRVEETLSFLRDLPAPGARRDMADRVRDRLACEDGIAGGRPGRAALALGGALAATLLLGWFVLLLGQPPGAGNGPGLADRPEPTQRWLVHVQEPDGRWDAARWGGHPQYEIALTALSMLALLDEHHPHPAGEQAVRRAARYLIGQQRADGSFGTATQPAGQNQVFATLALAAGYQRYGEPGWRNSVDAAIQFTERGWPRTGGWSYGARPPSGAPAAGWHIDELRRQAHAFLLPPPPSGTPAPPAPQEAWQRVGGALYAAAITCIRL